MTQHTDMGGLTRREQIARIIDPAAFRVWQSMYDYCIRTGDDEATARSYADRSHGKECADALAKADAIEALSIPQGLGEEK